MDANTQGSQRMELMNVCVIIGVVLGFYVFVRRFNEIWYLFKLGRKLNKSLPPGDLGWPFVGSTFSFYKAFKVEGDPYTFIHTLLLRYLSLHLSAPPNDSKINN